MAGEYFQLGQIDCLQGIDVPYGIGDVQVRMTYPGYRDSRFSGFGLQAPHMNLEHFSQLFSIHGQCAEIRRRVLDRVGAWQMEYPEMRSVSIQEGDLFERRPVTWHFDIEGVKPAHRILFCDATTPDVTGETILTTRHAYFALMKEYCAGQGAKKSIEWPQEGSQEYEVIGTELVYRVSGNPTSQSLLSRKQAIQHPDSVIRHFYREGDSERPSDIEPYSVLAWADHITMHAAPVAQGFIRARTLN